MIKRRIDEKMEKEHKYGITQMGFRKQRETIDAIFTLRGAIEENINKDVRKYSYLFC